MRKSDSTATRAVLLRHRERKKEPDRPCRVRTTFFNPDGSVISDAEYAMELVSGSYYTESIDDELPGFKAYGNVHHAKHVFQDHLSIRDWLWLRYSWDVSEGRYYLHQRSSNHGHGHWEYQIVGRTYPMYPGYPGDPQHVSFPNQPVWDLDSLCEQGFKAISAKIEPALSLPNFLLELRDIKAIVTGPLSIAKRLVSDFSSNRKLRGLLRASGSVILQDAYVNKTALRDITEIYSTFLTMREKLSGLFMFQDKEVVSHWSKTWKGDGEARRDRVNEEHAGPIVCTQDGKMSKVFTVTVRHRYHLTDVLGNRLNLQQLRVLGGLDLFGVNLNPAIVWDAIPFSFVVDWFADVQGFLESLRLNNVQVQVEVLDACYSIKEWRVTNAKATRHATRYMDGPKTGEDMSLIAAFDATLTDTSYTRRRFVPRRSWCGDLPNELSSPSWRQWVIGASLIVSR